MLVGHGDELVELPAIFYATRRNYVSAALHIQLNAVGLVVEGDGGFVEDYFG